MSDAYRLSAKRPREEVVVATFDTPHEAELARVFLASRNIEASLRDDTLVGVALLYSTALGGVKLLTDVDDAHEANDLLVAYRRGNTRRRKKKRERADDVARRAFRAALIGIFLCPGGLHLYSLLLLSSLDRGKLTKSGRRNAFAAAALSSAIIVALVAALLNSC